MISHTRSAYSLNFTATFCAWYNSSSKFQFTVFLKLGFHDQRVSLNCSDVCCFLAFFALSNIKAYTLAFIECLEAFALNRAEMYKYIAALCILDEAETFTFVEPLDFTF